MKNYVSFLKKVIFFKMFDLFKFFFVDIISPVISSTQIACDAMCEQFVIQ